MDGFPVWKRVWDLDEKDIDVRKLNFVAIYNNILKVFQFEANKTIYGKLIRRNAHLRDRPIEVKYN